MRLIESILADAAAIATVRKDIHAHPELCFEENRTADLIAAAADRLGHSGAARTRPDRRRRHRAQRQQFARGRPARRHRRAADHRAQQLRACQPPCRQDARLRPRRPHRDAARGGPPPGQAPQFRRHGLSGLPAGRGRRRRCARNDRRRAVRTVSDGGDLRCAQLAGHGSRPVRAQERTVLREQQRVPHHDPRQGRACGDAAQRHRPGAGRLPAGAGLPDHHHAQQAADRRRCDLGDDDPCRRGHQCRARQLRDAGHGAHLHARGARPDRTPHARDHRAHLRRVRGRAANSSSSATTRRPSTIRPRPSSCAG